MSDVDYYRLERPDAALTEPELEGIAVSYDPATHTTANPPVCIGPRDDR